MRNWIIKLLGGVTKARHDRLHTMFLEQNAMIAETLDLYEMQSQWEQTKQARKQRRVH